MTNQYKKEILRDCRRGMHTPVLIYIFSDTLAGLLTVYTASVLGAFADAVFRQDFTAGSGQILGLLFSILITVLFVPGINFLGETCMLRYALRHEKLVTERFLDKQYGSVLRHDPGDIQYRLEWEANELRGNAVNITNIAICSLFTLGYLLYTVLRIHPLYSAIVFAISLIKLTVPLAVKRLNQKYDKETREYQSSVRAWEREFTENPDAVRLLNLGEALIGRLDGLYQDYFTGVQCRSIRCAQISGAISAFLDTFCTLAILFSGAVLVAADAITPGTVVAMIGYFGIFHSLMGKAGEIIRTLPILENNIARMALFYEDAEADGGTAAPAFAEISATDLSFAYGEEEVFQKLSFQISAGTKTAISGPNGSGKSTLVKVICGLLTPKSGCLFVNGEELRDMSLKSWREQIGYAPQDPALFIGSVPENIRIGRQDASDSAVEQVMDRLGILYLKERKIAPGQPGLSGGEMQKISIARALIREPALLVLDEPSNNLDADTLCWLRGFIADYDKTIVFISHDPNVTSCADNRITLA